MVSLLRVALLWATMASLSLAWTIPPVGIRSIAKRAIEFWHSVSPPSPAAFSQDEIDELDAWLSDSVTMAKTALRMLDRYAADRVVASTLVMFLGVDMTVSNGQYAPIDASQLQNFKAWLNDVVTFGEGGFANFGYSEAWLMKGDSFQVRKSYDDMVQRDDGRVVMRTAQDGTETPVYLREVSAFKTQLDANNWIWYLPGMGSYLSVKSNTFTPGQAGATPGSQCTGAGAFTGTARGIGSVTKSLIAICKPATLKDGTPVDHFTAIPYKLFADVPEQMDMVIEKHFPRSTILLHEMMHAVRQGKSPDYANTSPECFSLRKTGKSAVSPACVTSMVVAMNFLDKALKAGSDPVTFWTGPARTATDAVAWLAAQNKPKTTGS